MAEHRLEDGEAVLGDEGAEDARRHRQEDGERDAPALVESGEAEEDEDE